MANFVKSNEKIWVYFINLLNIQSQIIIYSNNKSDKVKTFILICF